MEPFFDKIVNALEENGNIGTEDREVYLYALNTVCIYVTNIAVSVIIGIIMGMLGYCIVFLCAFILLRQDAGGYHAPGWKSCYLLSGVILIAALTWIKISFPLKFHITVVLAVLSAIGIFVYAPLEDENKPLDDTDRKGVQKRARIFVILEVILGLLSTAVHEKISYALLSSVVLCGITYVAWFVKKKYIITKK